MVEVYAIVLLSINLLNLVFAQCPKGYVLSTDSSSCYKIYSINSKHYDAVAQCTDDGGKLASVHSAFDNNYLLDLAIKQNTQIWLGMKCTGSNSNKCHWDDSSTYSYNNFYSGMPNTGIGECVYMAISGGTQGYWLSANCDLTSIGYACMVAVNGDKGCNDYSSYNGMCYRAYTDQLTYTEAQNRCENECGNLVSIHSNDENDYVRSLFGQTPPLYTWIGLFESFQNVFQWNDNSFYDYNNFGHIDLKLGPCISLALKQEVISSGQWINANCENSVAYVCKRAQGPCNLPGISTQPPTDTPAVCDGPKFYDGSGNFYSPGYPKSYSGGSQICDYILTVAQGYQVSINFPEFNIDGASKVELYNTLTDSIPFQTLRNPVTSNAWYTSTSDTMKVIFHASNPQPIDNYRWSAFFKANGTVPVTNYPWVSVTPDPKNPSGCNDPYLNAPGVITSLNWPNDYPDSSDCAYLLQTTYGYRISLIFNQIITEECNDIIQVFDGPGMSSYRLDRFSGNYTAGAKSFRSSGNQMYVLFDTDSNIHFSGWSATFTAVK